MAFDADRRALAEKYAASAATALENARLYDSAQRANRARDEVLGIVSHDLRNPISAIAMCARVLQGESAGATPRSVTELLVTIQESTEWVNRLIQDLLDVANIERERCRSSFARTSRRSSRCRRIHMFEVEARQHGIALEARIATNLPLVAADGARVVQVLGNLLRNAIKFTPHGGRVVIAVEPRTGRGVLGDGYRAGYRAERQASVFDRYWQSSEGARRAAPGLGLSIAKGIVDAHGGRIWVESSEGQGEHVRLHDSPERGTRGYNREEREHAADVRPSPSCRARRARAAESPPRRPARLHVPRSRGHRADLVRLSPTAGCTRARRRARS